ncbi:hypothetical protein [Dokdonella sp.]|uniref:hypothetical protein n=1 Tax=Dokdonella sp. TaxID=2291710 RepID=UPI001B271180|nr:hypothetical protein [Dokdonella sp.]MBO9664623.1 hypothetical protein [Dokdonella sp.]
MTMKSLGLAVALIACGFASTAVAKRGEAAWTFKADTPAAFAEQATKVREGMRPSGPYAGISASDRRVVESELDKIGALLERKGSASALSDGEQVELANAQERVNAILTRNDGDRLVCTYERRSGSNFKYKNCMTASERERTRQKSQEGMDRLTRQQPVPDLKQR